MTGPSQPGQLEDGPPEAALVADGGDCPARDHDCLRLPGIHSLPVSLMPQPAAVRSVARLSHSLPVANVLTVTARQDCRLAA